LGEVPRGWGIGTIGDIAMNVRRSVQPDSIVLGTPYIALEHMPRGSISLSDWGVADGLESNKYEFKLGEILFGKLRPYFHKVGVAPINGVCSTDILVIRPQNPVWFGMALGHISSRELIDYTTALSTGCRAPTGTTYMKLPFLPETLLRNTPTSWSSSCNVFGLTSKSPAPLPRCETRCCRK
jgi:type I restriction enzyme, S subunit